MPLSVHTSEAFAKHIERSVTVKQMSYMEAVIEFCEERQLEPEAIVPFLNDKIKNALAHEGQRLHLLPKMSSLPLD
jgi:hypothetical protein